MTFTSAEFLALFTLVTVLYHVGTHRFQNTVLLVASYTFYGWWDWRFLGLLIGSSLIDYASAIVVEESRRRGRSPSVAKVALAVSVGVNLGALVYFKYCNFFLDSVNRLGETLGASPGFSTLEIILPVGISFIAFQSMSYTIDVYKGCLPAERNLFDFLLYLSFFPQLVAGPIERADKLMPQIKSPRRPTLDDFGSGLALALWGFFKKIVIADNLAPIVNTAFSANNSLGGVALLLCCYAFAFQIYCDFSAYSDIARGIARTLGFELMVNFRLPYLASNPSDFWRRWHISLSTWLKDYVYVPLGGNRKGPRRTLIHLFIVMLLGGLWHGAAWHFVFWGAYQGLLLAVYHTWTSRYGTGAEKSRWRHAFQVACFFQLTCLGWLIFRVDDMPQFVRLLGHAISDISSAGLSAHDLSLIVAASVALPAFEWAQSRMPEPLEPWKHWRMAPRVAFNLVLIYSIVLFAPESTTTFIYFQF